MMLRDATPLGVPVLALSGCQTCVQEELVQMNLPPRSALRL
jgi:hypothetical protein